MVQRPETCDEGLDQCVSDPRDCSDELFCTINETCDDVINACMSDPRDCTDGDICTDDSCDEANDECDNVFDVTNDPSCAAPTPTPTPGPCANATITVQVTQCDAGVAGLSVALHSSYGDVYGPKGTNAAGQAAFSVIGGSDRAWYALVNGTTMGPTIKVTQCGGAGTIGVVLACVPRGAGSRAATDNRRNAAGSGAALTAHDTLLLDAHRQWFAAAT